MESKSMTIEMIKIHESARKLAGYVEALKSRIFVRRKTIVDAINARDYEYSRFWICVTKTWPETRGLPATIHKDDTVSFHRH